MGVRILTDKENGYACLYCSTTEVVFGEIFHEHENIIEFLDWLPKDARQYTQKELSEKISEWRSLVNPNCD